MKTKLMALLLAVCLGVTGVAATVQAAEIRAEETQHVHDITGRTYRGEHASDYNQTYHAWYTTWHLSCSGCEGYDINEIDRFEIHDYENVYDNKGNMIMYYCTICDYKYYY